MLDTTDIKKLKNIFAIKKDLERFATKKDLKKYATKDDLKKELSVVVSEITNVVTTLGEGIQESLDRLKEHEFTLENHEHRLDKIEDKLFA